MQLLIGDGHTTSEEKCSSVLPMGLVSQETLSLLNSLGKGSIDEKLKRILNEKREQADQIAKLKSDLQEERGRLRLAKESSDKVQESHAQSNGIAESEQQKQLTKEITDLKNRQQRLEAENMTLQQEVKSYVPARKERESVLSLKNKRYDAQLKGKEQQIKDAERVEDELKQERRRLQREVTIRPCPTRVDDRGDRVLVDLFH